MQLIEFNELKGPGLPDNFANPFSKKKVKHIATWIFNHGDNVSISGTIKFVNGDTEGEQKFKADDFQSLLYKMDQFLNTI